MLYNARLCSQAALPLHRRVKIEVVGGARPRGIDAEHVGNVQCLVLAEKDVEVQVGRSTQSREGGRLRSGG
jgi:hypothetical protein